jgi:hypothetical protein
MAPSDKKGFVDLLVDTPVNGRLYMCVTCVEQAGRQAGMLAKDQSERLQKDLALERLKVEDLAKKLREEHENKVLSLKDAKKLLGV